LWQTVQELNSGREMISSFGISTRGASLLSSALAAAAMRAFMCLWPGPWQLSHWTPALGSKPFITLAGSSLNAVEWHLTQASDFCGSSIPRSLPIFLASAEASVS
jgi:hypothetical protein